MTTTELAAEKDFSSSQAVGKREEQEDSCAFSQIPGEASGASGLLLVVADGMGGHAAGRQASETAVHTFCSVFPHGGDSMHDRFRCAVEAANHSLAAAVDTDPENLYGMGTTLLAVAFTPQGLEWVSVGDSPLYLFRDGKLRQINADHSFRPLLHDMVSKGELSEEQAAASSLRNRLRSALIGGEIALIDHSPAPLPLHEGDIVLAASDGVQTLTEAEIAQLLTMRAPDDAALLAKALVVHVEAQHAPRQDNVTVGIVKPRADWLKAPFAFVPAPAS